MKTMVDDSGKKFYSCLSKFTWLHRLCSDPNDGFHFQPPYSSFRTWKSDWIIPNLLWDGIDKDNTSYIRVYIWIDFNTSNFLIYGLYGLGIVF